MALPMPVAPPVTRATLPLNNPGRNTDMAARQRQRETLSTGMKYVTEE